MSTIYNQHTELRYLRRKQLEDEAKVIGNYYRDIIRSYGVDVNYYKLNTRDFEDFKGIINQNTLLKHAYGYNITPNYSISSEMLSYMEVEQDIFQINKFGYNPDANVSFYFDSNDFACALASKLGQYKEIKIDEIDVQCEIPEITNECLYYQDSKLDNILKTYLSSSIFPYKLGFAKNEFYSANILSGKFQTVIDNYEFDKEYTIPCDAYEHTVLSSAFKSNPKLYKSFYYLYQNKEYLETMLFLTFKVKKIIVGKDKINLKVLHNIANLADLKNQLNYCNMFFGFELNNDIKINLENLRFEIDKLKAQLNIENNSPIIKLDFDSLKKDINYIIEKYKNISIEKDITKNILTGKLHGNILFYDLNKIGKYLDKIHPEVGDIVSIDFPDENNREQYEITNAFDKQLDSNGISPLLHKYIWKCNAKRHIDNYNNVENNEANNRLEEKIKFEQVVDNEIVNEFSIYDENQDRVYGGYGNTIYNFDNNVVDNELQTKYEWIDDGTALDLIKFEAGSKLMTTGYELLFMTNKQDVYKITTLDHELPINNGAYAEKSLKYLKATDDAIIFINILGESFKIVENTEITNNNLIFNLDSLYNKSIDNNNINNFSGSFYKFANTKTYLFATSKHLFAKLAGNQKTYQII